MPIAAKCDLIAFLRATSDLIKTSLVANIALSSIASAERSQTFRCAP
jgi:hypothetical protein